MYLKHRGNKRNNNHVWVKFTREKRVKSHVLAEKKSKEKAFRQQRNKIYAASLKLFSISLLPLPEARIGSGTCPLPGSCTFVEQPPEAASPADISPRF